MIPCTSEQAAETDLRVAMLHTARAFLSTGDSPNPTWWMTFTFRDPTCSATLAADRFRSWLSRWRRVGSSAGASPQGWRSPVSRILWCVETQLRGTAHIHALGVRGTSTLTTHCKKCSRRTVFDVTSGLSRSVRAFDPDWPVWRNLKESWFCHWGIARIFPFDPLRAGGVLGYLTKYMFKSTGESPEWGMWEEGEDY